MPSPTGSIASPALSSSASIPAGWKLVDTTEMIDFEDVWTGGYIFENEWQSFRTKRDRNLELKSVQHRYTKPGRYTVAVKVIDIFRNDTMTLFPITVG